MFGIGSAAIALSFIWWMVEVCWCKAAFGEHFLASCAAQKIEFAARVCASAFSVAFKANLSWMCQQGGHGVVKESFSSAASVTYWVGAFFANDLVTPHVSICVFLDELFALEAFPGVRVVFYCGPS